MASLLPLYLKKYYIDEPLFAESKIVTSIYNKDFQGTLDTTMINKVAFDEIPAADIDALTVPDYFNIMKVAASLDAVILAVMTPSRYCRIHK